MNREDIIRMAREAGYSYSEAAVLDYDRHSRFAALVASAEREACAKICEEVFDTGLVMAPVAPNLAAKIRARGNTKQFEPCPFIECDCDGNHPLNQPAIRARGDKHD